MYQKPTHYTEQKKKKSKCKLDTLLVLSDKNLPQCSVGDLSVVCTIRHLTYIERYNQNTHHF